MVTGQLSVPHQNPDGPSWADAAVWLSTPAARTRARVVPSPARTLRESLLLVGDVDTPLHLLRMMARPSAGRA
jgi:hypothetical protein